MPTTRPAGTRTSSRIDDDSRIDEANNDLLAPAMIGCSRIRRRHRAQHPNARTKSGRTQPASGRADTRIRKLRVSLSSLVCGSLMRSICTVMAGFSMVLLRSAREAQKRRPSSSRPPMVSFFVCRASSRVSGDLPPNIAELRSPVCAGDPRDTDIGGPSGHPHPAHVDARGQQTRLVELRPLLIRAGTGCGARGPRG